ncbi:DUF2510 domain-containing protein [Microbacterium esteraromaticum]|uniref:DUF2510 domain-containing protein n=1 Tax=Microbacterium esteraromaticum TaxID=57043 RepID=UPI0023682924|nr:DUF2510 domain-containing protein [Microbacterium esteraromaticum]WDH78229.1 DUF2510 domain-containing protein [Microbacterium esteraromaticum]
MTSQLPPPGWYPTPSGEMQWWDGSAWSEPATQPTNHTAGPATARTGSATAALIVGIGAFLIGWFPIIGAIIGVIGVALGASALLKRQPKGRAVTGIVLSALAIVFSIVVTIAVGLTPPAEVAPSSSSSPAAEETSDDEPEDASSEEIEPATPDEPAEPPTKSTDTTMTDLGWSIYESGNIYFRFADKSSYTCGYTRCSYVEVMTISGCPNMLYVEASLLQGDTVVGMTNDALGQVRPEESALAHLQDFNDSADTFRLSEIACY